MVIVSPGLPFEPRISGLLSSIVELLTITPWVGPTSSTPSNAGVFGAVKSIIAESLPGFDSFLAASTMVEVTVTVAPSGCAGTVVVIKPLALSVAAITTCLTVPSLDLTTTISPTSTKLGVNETFTSISPFNSARLMKWSLFASSVISTTGDSPPLGGVVSIIAESELEGEVWPD